MNFFLAMTPPADGQGGNSGIIIIMLAAIFLFIYILVIHPNRIKKNIADFKCEDFFPTHQLFDFSGSVGFAIDAATKKVCILKIENNNYSYKYLTYFDILSSEVLENSKTITKTSRTSQIGGELIGAIIGGLSAYKESTSLLNSFDLLIAINDISEPLFKIKFKTLDEAKNWHARISVIIKEADLDDLKEKNKIKIDGVKDTKYEDIDKLGHLKNAGFLTEDEFNEQKKKILT